MTRLLPQDPRNAAGSNKEIFDTLQKHLGMVPNMTRVMGNSPAVLKAYAQFSGAMGGGKLGPKLREQIALLTAENNACTYCLSAHSALGKLAGLTQDQMDGARHGEASDPRTLAALTLAQAVIDTRGGISDADFAAARRAGLTDAELAEVVGEVALNYFTNIFNRAFAVEVDFPRVEAHKHASTH
ncbi:MAG: carboxymuconolactone decarboxylase family protein [Planctomycetota bacterium]|nr:carboxymuconolactone decarboxylase family protein [Planctomycetota bacterium]